MALNKYKIKIYRSLMGNYTWNLFSRHGGLIDNSGEDVYKIISESPKMYTRKENVLKIVNPIAKSLKAKIEYLDLSKDYEE